ncbi:MAG TPA: CDP-diacylglycerol diphosphatase [Steroidobacteraceae bacterium]
MRAVILFLCAATAALSQPNTQEVRRDALRHIVQDECVPHWLQNQTATPCASVTLSDSAHAAQGYAVLPDIKGGAHFLLIPTKTVRGIESAFLLEAEAPNYFAAAWQARAHIASQLGHSVARDEVGFAVNPQHARTQDQLHIHIECLGPYIHGVLQEVAAQLTDQWSPLRLAAGEYAALRVTGEDLNFANPFQLLAKRMPGARSNMGAYTLLLTGMQFKEGPGFIVLAGKNVPGTETLLDSSCAIAAHTNPHPAS